MESVSEFDSDEILGVGKVEVNRPNDPELLRDFSSFWDLPFKLEDLALTLGPGSGRRLATRLGSENRAFGLPKVIFRCKGGSLKDWSEKLSVPVPKRLMRVGKGWVEPVSFSDLLIKGVGMDGGKKGKEVVVGGVPIYFERERVKREGNPGPPAGASIDGDISLDEAFSVWFAANGGRTRLPVATWKRKVMETEEGLVVSKKAMEKLAVDRDNDVPVLSVWGMRSRWRLDDVVALFGGDSMRSTKDSSASFDSRIHPAVECFVCGEITKEVQDKALALAKKVLVAAKVDDDKRWRVLAEKYGKVRADNLSSFYLDYFGLLSRTIGEQFGLLYRHKIYLSMYNFQNITVMAELVDFDVATIDGKEYIDGTKLTRGEMQELHMLEDDGSGDDGFNEAFLQAKQLFEVIFDLTKLFSYFRVGGIITVEPDELRRRYDEAVFGLGEGFVDKGFVWGPRQIKRDMDFIKELEKSFDVGYAWKHIRNPVVLALNKKGRVLLGGYGDRLENKRMGWIKRMKGREEK